MNGEQKPAVPPERKPSPASRLRGEMPPLKQAILWSEILGRPLSRRGKR